MTETEFETRPFRIYSSKRLKIYNIGSDRFKTNHITVSIINEMNQNTAGGNALIARILKRGCKKFPSSQMLERELDDLYGAAFDVYTDKRGIYQCVNIVMSFVANNYIGEDITRRVLDIISGVIFEPVFEDEIFKADIVDQEKQNHIDVIRSIKNDKGYYSLVRCLEEMFKGEQKGIRNLGTEEQIREMDAETLTHLYQHLVSNSSMCIFLSGQYTEEEMQCVIDRFEHYMGQQSPMDGPLMNKSAAAVSPINANVPMKSFTEQMEVQQGKLAIGFKTDILPNTNEFYALVLANEILGGGLTSKMFNIIREKNSLAYSASSQLFKYRCAMVATCGIEFANRDRVRELVLELLKEVQEGDFSQEDLDNAKKSITNQYRTLNDSPVSFISFNFGQRIIGSEETPGEIIEKIEAATLEDVADAAKHIFLSTEYYITAKEANSNE